MHSFREGDLVRIKCGGPDMSILCIVEDYVFDDVSDTGIFCIYQNEHMLYEQAYPPRALDLVRSAHSEARQDPRLY